MKNRVAIQFVIQAIFFVGLFAVLFYYGGASTLTSMFCNAKKELFTFAAGLSISTVCALFLFVTANPPAKARLAIFLVQAIFTAIVVGLGSMVLIATPFPLFFAYKYWRGPQPKRTLEFI